MHLILCKYPRAGRPTPYGIEAQIFPAYPYPMQTHRAALCLLIATCLAGCESPAPSHSHLLNALVDLHTHQLDAAKIELARADPGDPAVQHMWGAYYNNHAVFLCRHAQEDKALQEFKRAGQLNPDLKQVVQHNKQHCPLNRRI